METPGPNFYPFDDYITDPDAIAFFNLLIYWVLLKQRFLYHLQKSCVTIVICLQSKPS